MEKPERDHILVASLKDIIVETVMKNDIFTAITVADCLKRYYKQTTVKWE
jgi:hypothetical protein